MKIILCVLQIALFSQLTFASDEVCPSDWAVAIKINNNYTGRPEFNYPALRVNSTMINDQEITGDRFLDFNKTLLKIEENNVVGNFIVKNGKNEVDIQIGKVIESVDNHGILCLNIKINTNIGFEEIIKKHKTDCFPLPDWMCGKMKTSYLRISTEQNETPFVLDSDTSFSVN